MTSEKFNRILLSLIGVLGVGFAAQIAFHSYFHPMPRVVAAWAYEPRDLGEAKGLARHIVEGQVVGVERGDDIVVKAPGEPGDVERIGVEVVSFRVDGSVKGQSGKDIKLFHTAGMPVTNMQPPPMSQAPPKPAQGATEPPARFIPFAANTVNIHDDPEYQPGQRYFLFLREGPQVRVKGQPVATFSLLSPSTRLLVLPNNKLAPAVQEGLGFHFRGQDVNNFREMVGKAQERMPIEGKEPGRLLLPALPPGQGLPDMQPGAGGVMPRGLEGPSPDALGEVEVPLEGTPPAQP